MSDGARAALAKEREAMAIKLGFNSTERERVDLGLLDEFIRIEKVEGPIAFHKKQRELLGSARERRQDLTACCPNCGNALTIRIERA